ncbi:MAG: PIN domain-containing protein [Thermoplasmata archaeon]
MKALDTPVLLALLQGAPTAKALLKSLSGEELATTEANMLELSALAARSDSRTSRIRALERLRRRLTVLPIDPQAVVEVTGRRSGDRAGSMLVWAMYGALQTRGCAELITDTRGTLPGGRWRFKVRRVRL